jgi:hypothetical protein
MAMPRQPFSVKFSPYHNGLPGAGTLVWHPLHGSFATMTGAEAFAEVSGSTPAAAKWSGAGGYYTFTTDNGATSYAALLAPHDEDDNLDAVMGLTGADVDTQLIVSHWLRFNGQDDAAGVLWFYGAQNAYSCLGFGLGTGQNVQVYWRGVDATSSSSNAMDTVSGETDLDNMQDDAPIRMVYSIRVTAALQLTVEVAAANASLTGRWSKVIACSENSGTALPGRNGAASDTSHHPGLMFGAKYDASAVLGLHLGRGAGKIARVGTFVARKFATYDANRVADTLAAMLARPHDVPVTLA